MPDYVVVTTVQTFRHRYLVPVSECFTSDPAESAKDFVTMEEVKEFSQEWLGEQIVDTRTVNLEEAINLLDSDNPYLKGWSLDQKVNYISNWEEHEL